jgi:hypothetical protein
MSVELDTLDDQDEFEKRSFLWLDLSERGNHAYRSFLPPAPKPVFIEGGLLFEHQKRAFSGLMGRGRAPEHGGKEGRARKGQPDKREIPFVRNTPHPASGNVRKLFV